MLLHMEVFTIFQKQLSGLLLLISQLDYIVYDFFNVAAPAGFWIEPKSIQYVEYIENLLYGSDILPSSHFLLVYGHAPI